MNIESRKPKHLPMVLCITLMLTFNSSLSFGAVPQHSPHPAATPSPRATPVPAAGATVHVNPDTLEPLIMSGDTSVLVQLNALYQAKQTVNIKRGDLLPSFNLGMLLQGPSFILSSITVLLPFLIPSNWFAFDAANNQLSANGDAYYIVELNEYASALGLYESLVGDMELRSVYQRNLANLTQVYNIVQQKFYLGVEIQLDVDTAKSNMEMAQDLVSKVNELIDVETAQLRQLMGLSLDATVVFDTTHMAALPEESSTAQTLLAKAIAISPELQEAVSMVAAGKDGTWAAIFGFITGSSLSVATGNNATAGVNGGQSLVGSETIGIGGAYFPEIALSNENVSLLLIRQADVPKELGQMIESALGATNQAGAQVDETANALTDAENAYQATYQLYTIGGTDLLQLTTAATLVTNSGVAHAQALIDLDGQRITLNRALIKNKFSVIPTCVIKGTGEPGFFDWLKGIFAPSDMSTIDQICKPSATAAKAAA